MIRSLRRKFIAMTMVIVTVFLTVMLGFVIRTTAENLRSESVALLRKAAEEPLGHRLPGQRSQPCFVIRVTPWGYSIQSSEGFDLNDEDMLTDIVTKAAASGQTLGELADYTLRYYRQELPGELLTLAFADISAEKTTLTHLTWSCVGIGAAAVAVFWVICILLARWAVRPVERAWAEQRQFVADASHELKTPLTVILTNAELLQSPDTEEEQRSQYARSILTMSHRMRSLVEGLLELARVDNGAVRSAFGAVDLSRLVEEELLPFEPVYFERGLTLESQLEPRLFITGSARHLRQVIGVLLDNAMKYTHPDSTVRVRLTRQGASALLAAENPAPPLSREECQSIFLRFYRTDRARTGGGYGLGLPIARAIVTDHGGKIWAESQDGLMTLRVLLPLDR